MIKIFLLILMLMLMVIPSLKKKCPLCVDDQLIFIPPTKFCVYPVLGYWELNEKPVSSKEAQCGLDPGAKWMESEVCRELHLYFGRIERKG